ncbi:hypothetical protein H6P81_007133 [Aristolochia fimbriata]|uniref:Cilia- and flagella-associated protein 61 N-terminal domain-containing protein n=1 Tax=Aristolochia fimbriata TaxID=158543 RepID=A0AAV7F016_ARIFI|nr:hypothetical protein H6P81_007133 [Aristolochia fimbriata]
MKAMLLDARPLINVCGRFGFVPDLTHYHAAREYPQQFGVDACIRLFEQFKSYEGSYFLLGTYLSSRLDPDIHFKYIEGSAKTGQIEYVKHDPLVVQCEKRLDPDIHFKYIEGSAKTGQIEYVKRVTKESKFYDPEQSKNLLMKAKLLDARPLINVCGRFGFVPDLTHYHMILLLSNVRREDPLVEQCEKRLRDASYLKRDELLCIYIAKPTGIVAAYGFPVVIGERLDPDIHFMYIEGAAKTGQIKDVKSILPTTMYANNMLCYIEGYGQKVNPGNAPLVVVQLCDDECPEDFIKVLLYLSVLSFRMILLLSNVRRGSYFLLETYLSSRLDPDIHFKYIEGSSKTGQIKYVKRVTKESKFNDPEKTKNLLMKAKLPESRPLINICGRFGFVPDLTHYHVNPGNAPLVVVQLLDDECPEDFLKVLLYLSVLSFQRILLWSNAAKEYPQALGINACIRLFEQFKSYEGSYFFLWTYLCSRLDPDIHFMYIEGAAKTGQIKDVKVSYPLPCMPTTCFDILKDMGKSLTLSVRSFLQDDRLVEQCEKRLIDVIYLKRDELLRIYIAKATGIVSAYGFPVVVGERSYPLPCMPTIWFDILKDMAKKFHQSVRSFLPEDALMVQCEMRLIDAIYLKRDELLRIYIAKATGIVSAYGFPVAAKEYPQPLGVDACIRLFEQFKSYEGSYFFLGTYLSSRLDPDIHFKHVEGAAKTG